MRRTLYWPILYLVMTTSLFLFAEEKQKNFSLHTSFNQNLQSGKVLPLPGLGINYLHGNKWSLGFFVKVFSHKVHKDIFKIFELGQRVSYIFRLYHPFYLELGPKISYMRPLERNGRFNFASHKKYGALFALSPELSFVYQSPVNPFLLKSTVGYWISPGALGFNSFIFSLSMGLKF